MGTTRMHQSPDVIALLLYGASCAVYLDAPTELAREQGRTIMDGNECKRSLSPSAVLIRFNVRHPTRKGWLEGLLGFVTPKST